MLQYAQLDESVRELMLAEFDMDASADTLYASTRFTDEARRSYPRIMRAQIISGDDKSLADELDQGDSFVSGEPRLDRVVAVPYTAAITFAEGEFNRFYSRGICLLAFVHGSNEVVVIRARDSAIKRESSRALLGQRLPAQTLLDDLRVNKGFTTAFRLAGPNSGLSVACGCDTCEPLVSQLVDKSREME